MALVASPEGWRVVDAAAAVVAGKGMKGRKKTDCVMRLNDSAHLP